MSLRKGSLPTTRPIGTACAFFVRSNFLALAVPDEQVLRTSVFPNVFSRRDVFSLTILWYIASEIASALPLAAKKDLNSQKITRRPQQRKYKLQKIRKNGRIFCKNLAKHKRRVKFAMPRLSVHTYPPLMVRPCEKRMQACDIRRPVRFAENPIPSYRPLRLRRPSRKCALRKRAHPQQKTVCLRLHVPERRPILS